MSRPAGEPARTVPLRPQRPSLEPKAPARRLPDRPIPTMGWPAFRYRLHKLLGLGNHVPRLSKREQSLYDQRLHAHLREQLALSANDELRRLADETPRATVAFINAKGAAATTTTTVYAASNFANQTRSVLIVLDANPASGTSAARLGKDYDETLSTQQLVRFLETDTSFREEFTQFIKKVRPTRYGVRPITATPIVSGNNRLPADEVKQILAVTQRQCEYLLVDTANDITEPVTLAVMEAADVFVFTANVAVHDSLRQLATTMQTMRCHGFADKVDQAVVVISNVPAGSELEQYKKFLNRVNIRDEVIEEYRFSGPFLAVPHDAEISRDSEVDLDALNWETLQAYRELDIVILEQAARRSADN